VTTAPALPNPPPRGTRPRNRRGLIIDAAAALFYQRGYAGVAMSDIADAVAIRPSALYRHFPSKRQLLTEVVLDRVAKIVDAPAGDPDQVIAALVATALDQREIGVLWQREGRHLTDEGRAETRSDLRRIRDWLADLIQARRPGLARDDADLLAHCAMSVLSSPSFHHLQLPRADYERLLAELATGVITTDLPPARPAEIAPLESPSGIGVRSRRETLLTTAIVMFAEQGYAAVGMEDIAARVGASGASIYHHFSSKADLLWAGFQRGNEWLRRDLIHAVENARDHAEALHRLMRSYATFTVGDNQIIDLLITELGSLPPEEQVRARQDQHDYIDEWVHILRTIDPSIGAVPARIRVQAWFTVVNDVARNPRVRDKPGLLDALDAIGVTMLAAPRA
jgi:AcrR family transcriptional regulator